MSDYSEIKKLAQHHINLHGDAWHGEESLALASVPTFSAEMFIAAASPTAVLSLIEEVDTDKMHFSVMGELLEKLVAERDQLKAENELLRKDAMRWRAFVNCARIKFFGWAGYGEKDPYGNSPGNYRHFGGEFWTLHDAPTADKTKAAEILNGFADAAVATMNLGAQS